MLKDIKGDKYPDEYFIKFFFSNKLDEMTDLNVLELGCRNGNNLMLPYSFGASITGIDIDQESLDQAKHNFECISKSDKFKLYLKNMRRSIGFIKNLRANVFILPSSVYYVSKLEFIELLDGVMANNVVENDSFFYIRVRSKKDFRFGFGERISCEGRYRMPVNSIVGEDNTQVEFYDEYEIVNILIKHLKIREFKVFNIDYQNEHNGDVVLNSDIVIWGRIN